MKKIILLAGIVLTLNAGYFTFNDTNANSNKALKSFRKSSSNGNALLKKGDFEKYSQYKEDITTLRQNIDSFDLTQEEKKSLHANMKEYTKIIDNVYKSMKHQTPNLNKKYNKSLNGLLTFNNGIQSTGYGPLLNAWYSLTKVKRKYIKHPSYKLSQEFNKKYQSVYLVLTDLCLDEELEDPLLEYLAAYKAYFKDLNHIYKVVHYDKIRSIKPLSYMIKSELEFANK